MAEIVLNQPRVVIAVGEVCGLVEAGPSIAAQPVVLPCLPGSTSDSSFRLTHLKQNLCDPLKALEYKGL